MLSKVINFVRSLRVWQLIRRNYKFFFVFMSMCMDMFVFMNMLAWFIVTRLIIART